jgi:hypothetical protein
MNHKKQSPMDALKGATQTEKPKQSPPPTLQQAAALNKDINQDIIDQTNSGFFGSFFKNQGSKSSAGQLSQVRVFNLATNSSSCFW